MAKTDLHGPSRLFGNPQVTDHHAVFGLPEQRVKVREGKREGLTCGFRKNVKVREGFREPFTPRPVLQDWSRGREDHTVTVGGQL
jgi:hypothetical protein